MTTAHEGAPAGGAGDRPHVRKIGTVDVPLPASEAFQLFTPEGERRWVEGWAPEYPSRARSAGHPPTVAPGLVFTVGKESGASTWIVTRCDAAGAEAAYAYVLPGHRAVLVEVAVAERGRESRATVTYHMTSLSPAGDGFVEAFADDYEAFLQEWEDAIGKHVTASATRATAS